MLFPIKVIISGNFLHLTNECFSGSRTIRTEEAVLITLSSLVEKVKAVDAAPEFKLKDLIAQSEDTGNVNKFVEPLKRKNKVRKPKVHREASAAVFSGSESEGKTDSKLGDKDDMSRFD